ncbi:Carboxypeptidase regulatory-like domain-containing protein [Granulicella pectinivorans]|uniref:Carboxypeptidase regulatory-like domain-containing protein n=1 Tax=Granulicella pectinivorans TaxID=474950 RepID=A0A1I6M9K6_9BACT|nr:TonB-dependent receptor [Granulicella pectinivorans]SFS12420.1 Carboxypeptidase regulatory-like domain-containing protein [Granulicella pectinivorans]
MSKLSRTLLLSALTLSLTASGFSQSQSINGTIRGQITDVSGAPIPNAAVTVKNIDNGYTRQLTSDGEGRYIAPNLPIGTYSVSTTSSNFAPYTQSGVHVGAGSDSTVDESLKTGSVGTEITVTSDSPMIEAARADLSRTITSAETQNLPLTSRNPYNFILFQPGVSGHPNPENGIPRTMNTNGLVDRVNYQLDGMVDTESDRYGLRLFAISDSYTDTVQTISNAFTPEFGNTAGVIYNVITPAGTNALHGAVQYIWRPKVASSCPILQNCNPGASNYKPLPDLHVDDLTGRVGGPIIKNRVFFFGAYEHLKRGNPQAITVTPANQAALIAAGVPLSDFGTAPQVQRAQWMDARLDVNINAKNTAFVRYNYFRNTYPFNTNAGGLYLQSAEADFRDRAHIIGAQLITTFKPTLLNEFRGSWPYRNQQHFAGAATGPGPMVTISGVANFGGTNSAGDKFQEKIPSFSDNVTLIHGGHSFKFGTALQKNNDTQLADVYTQFTFATLADYLNAKNGINTKSYSNVTASIGRPGAGYQTVFFALFAQDTWQITHKLVANYGVRYDQYRAPNGLANAPLAETQNFRIPMGNFAPRVGLSYSPFQGTVVRLSGGMFYEATPTNSYYNPLYANGLTNTGNLIATLGPTTVGAPNFPNTFNNVPVSSLPTPTPFALTSKFKNEYTWNINTQVEQALGKNDALTIGYVMTNGRNLQFLRNSNVIPIPGGALADGRPTFSSTVSATTRYNPAFNSIRLIDIGANSSYHALITNFVHRMSGGLTLNASYTWSHAISDAPEGNSYENSNYISDPTNRKRDRGNSYVNRPNAFTTAVVYQPVFKFNSRFLSALASNNNLAVLVNASSGDAQNEVTGSNLNGDALSVGQQRPLFVGRNTLRTPAIVQPDVRFTRTFGTFFERVKPQIFVEANNVLNRSNVTSINTTATTITNPALGQVGAVTATGAPSLVPTSTVLEARILQFGAKIEF